MARILADTELPAELLQLELTESALVEADSRPLETLQKLSAIGVRIAADDFGSGYSNLAYLRRLPVDALKLSASFIQEVWPDGPADEPIISALASAWPTPSGWTSPWKASKPVTRPADWPRSAATPPRAGISPRPPPAIRSRPCSAPTSARVSPGIAHPDSHREDAHACTRGDGYRTRAPGVHDHPPALGAGPGGSCPPDRS